MAENKSEILILDKSDHIMRTHIWNKYKTIEYHSPSYRSQGRSN
jgi:hypothetical protein